MSSVHLAKEAPNPRDGPRNHKPKVAVGHMIAGTCETQMSGRPQFGGGWSEEPLMKRERLGILTAVIHLGLRPAGRRVMMQWHLQPLSAPQRPIVARIDQVLVPDLVDHLARRDRCRRDDGEKAESTIGVDGRAGRLKT